MFFLGLLAGAALLYVLARVVGPPGPVTEKPPAEALPPEPAGEPVSPDPPAPATLATSATSAANVPPGTEIVQPQSPDPSGRLALVIDDLGRDINEVQVLKALGIPISYSVLPFEEQTQPVVAALRAQKVEILCHLPMEPKNGQYDPGPGALRLGMGEAELQERTLAALQAVPGATGVNNHMGSVLSENESSMRAILGVLATRNLFFLDSRTSPKSVGYRIASSLGMPAAERQVFLDDDPRDEAITKQLERWLALAKSKGAAIAIGHPHPQTLAVLAREVPRIREAGYQFVPVSFLLDRPGSPD
jgi:uncharacterized protein